MSMKVPEDLRYTKEHEWAKLEGGRVRVGITDFAQSELTDIVYVELPKPGAALAKGKSFGVVESVKSTSELFAPLSGKVVETNAALAKTPELVNKDPYGQGWMILVEPADEREIASLLTATQYLEVVEKGGH
jgi:glycine cleavage system H protein